MDARPRSLINHRPLKLDGGWYTLLLRMASKHSAMAVVSQAILRSSPPLRTLSKATLSNRHHLRVLLSFLATRNLLKSLLTFRPVNRRTLKPGTPLWKVLLKALWLALWPGLSHRLAELVVQRPVSGRVEVEACEEGSVSVDVASAAG